MVVADVRKRGKGRYQEMYQHDTLVRDGWRRSWAFRFRVNWQESLTMDAATGGRVGQGWRVCVRADGRKSDMGLPWEMQQLSALVGDGKRLPGAILMSKGMA